jgi:pyrrolidone-carboxylate peptidase
LARSSITENASRATVSDANFGQLATFLPGSGQKVEVTEKKRLNPVYPVLELHVTVAQSRAEFPTESQAQSEKDCRSRDAAEQSKIPLTIRNEKELS